MHNNKKPIKNKTIEDKLIKEKIKNMDFNTVQQMQGN